MRISDWSSDVCSSDLCGEDQRSPARWREFCGTGDHVGRSAAKPEACHEAKCQQHPPIGGPSGGDCERAEDRDADHHGFASPQAIRKRAKRSEEHTSELQSLMRISSAVFCLKKKTKSHINNNTITL